MAPEPRRHLPVPIPVGVCTADGRWRTEYAVNLSAGGLCLQLPEALIPGEAVQVAFELPHSGTKLEVVARVVWAHREARFCEMGLAFEELDPEAQEALRRYVRSSPGVI